MYVNLLLVHPHNGIIVDVANFVTYKKLLGCHHTAKLLRLSSSGDRLKRYTSNGTWLPRLKSDILRISQTPQTNVPSITSDS